MSSRSKFLALVLRHKPEEIGIELDSEGWTSIPVLLSKLEMSREELDALVAADAKGRYSISPDGERIRANQGHSVPGVLAVSLNLVEPPDVLYHGTTRERWLQIQASGGLKPGSRHHVHLSADERTAKQVGSRHRGELVVLRVDAAAMHERGLPFYRSENGVWMADFVPLEFVSA